MPGQVRWALRLLWLCLIFNVAQHLAVVPAAVEVLPPDGIARGAAILGLSVPVALLLFEAFVNLKIAAGRNWARIAKFLLLAADVYFQVALSNGPGQVEIVSAIVMYALGFAALYLLFLTPGRLWFRQQ